ncbi:transmembrane protein 26-like [Rana temporaria]|uniref:transmembrane protein 26-like n=1 Tax=Rana temporaria TaxID=8407 RepID=UPI001AAC6590|nr:transmembrane protein 26-like [Rana temporaria]
MKSNSWKSKCRKFLSAFISRFFFGIHGIFMIRCTVDETKNNDYMYLLFIIVLLFIEMAITLALTDKGEWKWFSPMVFIYLCAAIPSIFLLELKLIHLAQKESNVTTNTTCDKNQGVFQEKSTLVQVLEQALIVVLILGRWLMPKGGLNREQLSQLLLIYLGLGADILDLLQLIREKSVNAHPTVAIVGLCLFCWTITQFTIVLTQEEPAPKSQKTSVTEESLSLSDVKMHKMAICSSNEVQNFLITVTMHDGPFLVYRVYVVILLGEVTDSIVFFIFKNILKLALETYRLGALLYKDRRERNKYEQN